MWAVIQALSLTTRLYFLAGVVAVLGLIFLGGDLYGRHREKLVYYKANNALVQSQVRQDKKDTNEALQKEKDLATDLAQLEAAKKQVQDKLNEFSKDDPCTASKLSADELQYLNSLIKAANE